MEKKIILDLCGGTGAWSKPYRDAGYDVRVITLPDYSVGDCWVVGDILRFRKNKWKKDGMTFLDIPIDSIYGVLAAPPCTMFSIARTVAKIPRDFKAGIKTVNDCIAIVHRILETGHSLEFWALENPTGHLRKFLGKPPYTFYQWQFDQTVRHKPTDVWGNFNFPKPVFKEKIGTKEERARTWGNPRKIDNHSLDRSALRAITPAGFAQAFYEANK
jgi:hypothetical protein